ncbi:MAG: hypothetical protein ABI791_15090 [Acidobacteriota bacterium]
MGRLIGGLVIGFLIGGVLTYILFVGAPRASNLPGQLIKAPDASGLPPGTAEIVLRQEFFNQVLGTLFRDMNPPSFPLGGGDQQAAALTDGGCASKITVLPEGSGVQTGVRFENNKLGAPLAFTGSYQSPVGCLQFSGWAKSTFELRYDAATQSVFGRVNVETVNLDGINPVFSALVTPIVQSTLNTRVNPIRILDGRQIAVNLPIAATGGILQAKVMDVRSEVKDNALNLYAIYEFGGVKNAEQAPAANVTP